MNHFELTKPTYIENWSRELCSLSLAQVNIEISYKDIINPLLEFIWENKPTPVLKILEERLDRELQKFPKGAFIRLGSRSPKDFDIKPVFKGKEALKLLLSSMRIFDDLCEASANKYNAHIFLREWIKINPAFEFRCFMKDRKLIGISQYNYLNGEVFPEIKEHKQAIEFGIKLFFKKIKKATDLNDVIFDVFVTICPTEDGVNRFEIKLLEINPFLERTDPCLFDWRNPDDFNGEFRIN